jgi:hypothetical protein
MFWNYAIQVNPPIHVVVENGHVTLTGAVNSEIERRKAETVARTTFGVFSVDNQLRLDSVLIDAVKRAQDAAALGCR